MRMAWQMWSGGLSSDICDRMIEEGLKGPPQAGGVFDSGIPADYRKSTIRWCNHAPWVQDLLYEYVKEANRNAFKVSLTEPTPSAEFQFTEYHGDQNGHYGVHHDVDFINDNPLDRKLSITVQLSNPEDYEGGSFEFYDCENPQPDQLRRRGTILVFPSYFAHAVHPVTSGIRYSMVAWFSGPRWK